MLHLFTSCDNRSARAVQRLFASFRHFHPTGQINVHACQLSEDLQNELERLGVQVLDNRDMPKNAGLSTQIAGQRFAAMSQAGESLPSEDVLVYYDANTIVRSNLDSIERGLKDADIGVRLRDNKDPRRRIFDGFLVARNSPGAKNFWDAYQRNVARSGVDEYSDQISLYQAYCELSTSGQTEFHDFQGQEFSRFLDQRALTWTPARCKRSSVAFLREAAKWECEFEHHVQSANSPDAKLPRIDVNCHKSKGVIYFNTGRKCLVRLAVSLQSLRRHYDGPVTILSLGEESNLFFRNHPEVCRDFKTDVIQIELPEVTAGRNTVYLQKVAACRYTPYELTVFLDSDTLVRGSLDELWELAHKYEFVVPQFARWTTQKRIIKKRIRAWSNIYPDLISPALTFGPALNCGVFAFDGNSRFIHDWYTRIEPGRHCFLPDETGMQVLLQQYPHRIVDSAFNVSCKYDNPRRSDARVIHFHGRKHCRTDENGRLRFNGELWLEEFIELWKRDCSGISSWISAKEARKLTNQRGLPSTGPRPKLLNQEVTLVTAANSAYLAKLKATLPTWSKKPQLRSCLLQIFYRDLIPEDFDFVAQSFADYQLIPWQAPSEWSVRETMLSAFVFGAAKSVETPYWLKIDADTYFTDDRPVLLDYFFDFDFVGHKWNYTKPGRWLVELDQWAEQMDLPGEQCLQTKERSQAEGARRFHHRRIASWIALHRSNFTRHASALANERLPVPSHDTYLHYLAERLPEYRWCSHNLKKLGTGHPLRMQKA